MRGRASHRRGAIDNSHSLTSGKVLQVLTVTLAAIFLVWCVLTKSLPYALEESNPGLALSLNPDNPAALLSLAEDTRQKLLELTEPEEQAAEPLMPFAAINQDVEKDSHEIRALRKRINRLALRAVANDPRNQRGFRLLAEVSTSSDEVRHLMQEALRRSRREPIATLWLMADSVQRKDFVDVVKKADILLRTEPLLAPDVMSYLGGIAALPEGRSTLIATLAKRPSWRGRFFAMLPQNVRYAGTPFDAMIGLKNAGSFLTPAEVAPYLNLLVKVGLISYANQIWGKLQANENERHTQLLVNGDFARELTEIPFDWSIKRGQNATFKFEPDHNGNERNLQFEFGNGRVAFPELSQLVVLGPGAYRVSGELRGDVRAKRGLRWQVGCWQGKKLAETEMLFGSTANSWQAFRLDFTIPSHEDCEAQQLRLFHDSRSASEKFISGTVSFRRLNLVKRDR